MHDLDAYWTWAEQEPDERARTKVGCFLSELYDRPYAAPSVPVSDLSHQPVYQVREVSLRVNDSLDVWMQYRHDYATNNITVLDIRRR